jgi:hypothetical protein
MNIFMGNSHFFQDTNIVILYNQMSNCILTIVFLGVIVILTILLTSQYSSGYVLLEDNIDALEVMDDRVCRCIPYSYLAMRSSDWGKDVVCPMGTLLTGDRFWCTSDSSECVNSVCNANPRSLGM